MSDAVAVPAGWDHVHSGKVRDLYRTGDGRIVMVASDRMSAYDHILSTPIPDKGRVLTAMSVWWFERLADIVPNHLLATDDPELPDAWRGRTMICRPLHMEPVECVARGYLTGGGLAEYEQTGIVSGVRLPAGLVDGSKLPEPVFTPSTKAPVGEHDLPIGFDEVVTTVGADRAAELRDITLAVFARGAELAERAGILLADTKIELGTTGDGTLVLGDEVLTPDSSRFWSADGWEPGHRQPSYDKQFVRDWLTSPASGWDRGSDTPPPPLPDDVVAATRARYVEAYERITGEQLA